MKTSEQIDQIGAALAQAQAEMQHAAKDANNPHFKSKYADLASVMDACRPALAKAKVAVVQSPELVRETKTVRVTTRLIHASGQWVEANLEADVAKTDPQAIGSAITYLRRYGLASLASVAADDDDGNVAAGRGFERFEAPREVRREEPRREDTSGLREAFDKTVAAFPHLESEANRIFTMQRWTIEEKLAELRALYVREHKAVAAKAEGQSLPPDPAPASAPPQAPAAPSAAVEAALKSVLATYPDTRTEAEAIATSAIYDEAEKLSELRKLWEHAREAARLAVVERSKVAAGAPAAPAPTAPVPANTNAQKPDPKAVELRKRVNRLVEAAKREGVDVGQTLSEFGPLEQVSAPDLGALISELEAVLNARPSVDGLSALSVIKQRTNALAREHREIAREAVG